MTLLSAKEQLIIKLGENPRLAHQAFFSHRHPQDTPPFHYEIIDVWHDKSIKRALVQAFRGAAKSTIAEEAIIIQGCYRRFYNGIILGETYERAVERLRAIKHEYENNEFVKELFGDMVGGTWAEGKIILSNGRIIQAFGRGQSLRGSKHLDRRPDRAFGDDIENEESVNTQESISKTVDWLTAVVIPALDPDYIFRLNGTPLDPNSLISQLAKNPDWVSLKYPVQYLNDEGKMVPLWPSRFPLPAIEETKRLFYSLRKAHKWTQEYMCEAEDPKEKSFTADMFRVDPIIRVWDSVYSVYDPARTVKATSATTGVAHFSWRSNKLIVWDAYGERWEPNEIIEDIFKKHTEYSSASIGVEADGLHEFIMQPLRQEQTKRGTIIPIRALKAPRGKLDFIKSLQPFFKAGEIIFVKTCEDAVNQFLSFPSGQIDIPNALAYALLMRPGQLIYEEFNVREHVAETLPKYASSPFYLCLNATSSYVTGVLLQFTSRGAIHILWDQVLEGDSSSSLSILVENARMELANIERSTLRFVCGPAHYDRFSTTGLRQAAGKIPIELLRTNDPTFGRQEIRRRLLLAEKVRIASGARWTINGMASGYAKQINKMGIIHDEAEDNIYKTLMEGLECCVGLMSSGAIENDMPVVYETTKDGRQFLSSRGGQAPQVTKANWADILKDIPEQFSARRGR